LLACFILGPLLVETPSSISSSSSPLMGAKGSLE
jgi:hypothetical protein